MLHWMHHHEGLLLCLAGAWIVFGLFGWSIVAVGSDGPYEDMCDAYGPDEEHTELPKAA